MKLTGLDGKSHNVNISANKYPLRNEAACKSAIQYRCGQMIHQAYPSEVILEEFPLPGGKLTLDFFLPRLRVAFEIHGVQHDKFVGHFHKNVQGFHKSRMRDNNKSHWCAINNIRLFEVRSEDELREILTA